VGERAGGIVNLQPQVFDRALGRESQLSRAARRRHVALRKGREREAHCEK
jgi:hypothetical protein